MSPVKGIESGFCGRRPDRHGACIWPERHQPTFEKMTPKDHMERFARRVPGGGIAWENAVFTRSDSQEPGRLIDAAVDIAWERLLGSREKSYRLAINTQGRLLVFSVATGTLAAELKMAA